MQLSEIQKKAINHKNGPALVLAVPGAGKTTVIIYRTHKLIFDENIKPERILSITFSKASALDMKSRYITFFRGEGNLPLFTTIHSFCYKIIRDYMSKQNIRYTIIENEKEHLNKFNIVKNLYFKINNSQITEEKLDSFINYVGFIKNTMISPIDFVNTKNIDFDRFYELFMKYEEYKKDNFLLDFDDMLGLSYELLNTHPKALNYYRKSFDYIQLDEGQDTSKLQYEIIKLLACPDNNLFVVADDDQSIYGFRGASPDELLNFKKDFPKGEMFFMQDNFRSSKNIVSLSNNFIHQNKNRYAKQITTNNAYVSPIEVVKFKSILDQYSFILNDMENKEGTIAILYRNNISSLGLLNIFDKNNISFYIRDVKLKFFNHWIIKDILLFMELSLEQGSINLYENIYYKTKGYISKKMIVWLKTKNIKGSLFATLVKYPGLPEYYKKTIRELEIDFKKISKLSPYDSIEYIMKNLDYNNYLRENSMKFGSTYQNLIEMIFYLKLIAKETTDLQSFKDRLNHLNKELFSSTKNDSKITLSTIHSAKGLEFDSIYIIDLIDGSFPSSSSIEELENLKLSLYEEERRLFYVAMTRAKKNLHLLSYTSIEDKTTEPSRFLKELQLSSK
ncbi:MAG: ATP-dependent helicase [Gudongella sp.]|nr:ATP-dependent helicase [Gudongella sp.]